MFLNHIHFSYNLLGGKKKWYIKHKNVNLTQGIIVILISEYVMSSHNSHFNVSKFQNSPECAFFVLQRIHSRGG